MVQALEGWLGMEVQAPLTPQVVYAAISAATRVDAQERTQSENILRSWERDAVPGFLDSLLQISGQAVMVDEVSLPMLPTCNEIQVLSGTSSGIEVQEWQLFLQSTILSQQQECRSLGFDSASSTRCHRRMDGHCRLLSKQAVVDSTCLIDSFMYVWQRPTIAG